MNMHLIKYLSTMQLLLISMTISIYVIDVCLIIIIINLFIEGSLISAKALFCLRALFGATRIHSCTRMVNDNNLLIHILVYFTSNRWMLDTR